MDIVVEATGFSPLAFAALDALAPAGVLCLVGIPGGARTLTVEADRLVREAVLSHKAVLGSVSANKRHYEAALAYLRDITSRWPHLLSKMVTRRLSLEEAARGWRPALQDVKAVVEVVGQEL